MEKISCRIEDAPKFARWIAERGGVAHWQSQDLSTPNKSWSTPALAHDGEPYTAPHWSCTQARVVTSADDIEVVTFKEVERFRVAIRRGDGLRYNLTQGSKNKLNRALERHAKSTYEFDYETQEAVIVIEAACITLAEWIARQP